MAPLATEIDSVNCCAFRVCVCQSPRPSHSPASARPECCSKTGPWLAPLWSHHSGFVQIALAACAVQNRVQDLPDDALCCRSTMPSIYDRDSPTSRQHGSPSGSAFVWLWVILCTTHKNETRWAGFFGLRPENVEQASSRHPNSHWH